MTAEQLVKKLETSAGELGTGMQENDSVLAAAAKLESAYGAETGVHVTIVKGDVVGNVAEVGAAFNAPEGVQELTLRIEQSERAPAVPDYRSFLSLDIDLKDSDGNSVQGSGPEARLKVPVCIAMQVPADIPDPDKLVIHHYHGGSQEPDLIYPNIFTNANGERMLRFSVDRFSTFVFYTPQGTFDPPARPAEQQPVTPAGGNGAPATAATEYIICEACGHQVWEPYLEGWRCTTCGHLRGTTGVPAAAGKTTIPQTADAFTFGDAAAVFGVSLAGLGTLLLLRKKRR